MSDVTLSVLFLCKSNTARSIMGEAILNRLGYGKIRAFSAGSEPEATVHPQTICVLGESGYDIEALTPKSWTVFADSDAPTMDLVITVCDDLALDDCPVWPGRPARAHWSLPDPVKDSADHDATSAPFRASRAALEDRIQALLARLKAIRHLERASIEAAAHAA